MRVLEVPTPKKLTCESQCTECETRVELEPADTTYHDDQRDGQSWEWKCPTCHSRNYVDPGHYHRGWITFAKRTK